MAKLIEITGKAISGEWGNDDESGTGIPVLRTTNFTNSGIIDYSKVVTRDIKKKNLESKYLRYGDIIIEKSGGSDTQPVGRVVFFEGEENKYLFNNFTGLLRVADHSVCFPKYLFYFLYCNYQRGGTIPFQNKTTGLHNLKTDDYVNRCEVPLPPLSTQKQIAAALDKATQTIDLCNAILEKLDLLVKARFVELFGDDIKTTNLTIGDLSDEATVGIANSATHAYSDEGVVMLRNQNIRVNYLDDTDLIYITPKFAAKYESKALKENDILITRTGVNVGMACLVPKKYEGCQTFTTLILRLKKDIGITPMFVCHFINSPLGKDFIDNKKVGGAQPNFGAKQLVTMPIVIPSQNKQERFENMVYQTDKSKAAVKALLQKAETLKKALMQEYFG